MKNFQIELYEHTKYKAEGMQKTRTALVNSRSFPNEVPKRTTIDFTLEFEIEKGPSFESTLIDCWYTIDVSAEIGFIFFSKIEQSFNIMIGSVQNNILPDSMSAKTILNPNGEQRKQIIGLTSTKDANKTMIKNVFWCFDGLGCETGNIMANPVRHPYFYSSNYLTFPANFQSYSGYAYQELLKHAKLMTL